MDNFTAYAQTIKELQNNLLEPTKQVQVMQNSFLEVMQPLQSSLSEIQELCNSAYAPLQSLQATFTGNPQVQQQLSSIASAASQLQNVYVNPYIDQIKSHGSMLALERIYPAICNSADAFKFAGIAKDLAAQLTFPPVYSISSLAYDLKISMIDCENEEPTTQFKNFAEKVSELPPKDFEYIQVNDEEIEISPAMSEIINTSFPKSVNNYYSRKKSRIKIEFFSKILIPFLAFAIPFGYQIYSNHQSTIEDKKQTAYLQEIAESRKSCECNKHIDSPNSEHEHHYPEE